MFVPTHNHRYSNTTVLPGSPWQWRIGILLCVLAILGLVFFWATGRSFASFLPAPADSVQGEWVGVLDLPRIRDPAVRPYGKRAAIRFILSRERDFATKYGGKGEIVIEGQAPQAIEVTHLWLPKGQQRFEFGLWKDPYNQNDDSDYLSGGFEGRFQPGSLTLERQRAVGYDMTGTLHKGTDEEYQQLVRQLGK